MADHAAEQRSTALHDMLYNSLQRRCISQHSNCAKNLLTCKQNCLRKALPVRSDPPYSPPPLEAGTLGSLRREPVVLIPHSFHHIAYTS